MRNIRAGRLIGIPIIINPSWFILFGLTTWLLATQSFPAALPRSSTQVHIAMAAVSVVVFFVSIILHELAHSLVAKQQHIPVKSITLFVFGGVSHITKEPKRPLAELWMAFAGPLTSLLLAVVFFGVWWLAGANQSRPVDFVLFWLTWMNAALAIFNLVPAYPMDGGRIFRALVWLVTGNYARSTTIAGWVGRGFGWVMIGAGVLTLLGFDLKVVGDPSGGLWLVLLGFFLQNSARQSVNQSRLVNLLGQYSAKDLMNADPPVVDGRSSVAALARGVLDLNPRVCYFVEEEGRLAGILSIYQMKAVPERLWDTTTAAQAMAPRSGLHPTPPDTRANELLLEMESDDLTHMPVVEDGRVVGVVGRDRILGVLRQAGLLKGA